MLEIYDGIEIDEELFNEIKSIGESIYILAFAELVFRLHYKFTRTQKINDINPNIMFRILPKEDNEKYMGNYKTDTKLKIPTFIILNDKFEEIGAFVENPKILDSIISKGNQVEVVVAKRKYQKGEYVDETIKEIVDIITKK